jgi:hypothetical protein
MPGTSAGHDETGEFEEAVGRLGLLVETVATRAKKGKKAP